VMALGDRPLNGCGSCSRRFRSTWRFRAVSIKGQGGEVVVETIHEGLDLVHRFDLPELEKQGAKEAT